MIFTKIVSDCQKLDTGRLGSHPHHQPLGEFGEARFDVG